MSVLAHMIESRGIPTTVIGLVRPHMEKSQPPRGIWTPFQLGRPLGEPGDAVFQTRVIRQALSLLERKDGPVILEDFDADAPNWTDVEGWQPPAILPPPAPATPAAWSTALTAEMTALAPAWRKAQQRFGRTTIGLSRRPPEAWPDLFGAFLAGGLPAGPSPDIAAPALALRFAVDDIKAYYTEAAMAEGTPGSSRQIDAWFWRETLAGKLLKALRLHGMASDNNAYKTVAGRFFVPAPWIA